MQTEFNFEPLEQALDYKFKNQKLLITALSHSSYSNEAKNQNENYERLEFLGDSILGFVTAEYLYKTYPQTDEGILTKARAALVCEKACAKYSKALNIGDYILLGHGEAQGNGRNRSSILADIFEAVLAAVYLDSGIANAKKIALRFISEDAKSAIKGDKHKDFKTVLQEIVQKSHEEVLDYVIISEEGPAHEKTFTAAVNLNSNTIGIGKGKSKKEAEQQAAREALILMGESVE